MSRFCLPSIEAAAEFSGAVSTVMDSDTLEQWISDLRTTWPVIAGMCGVAVLLGYSNQFSARLTV